MKKVILGIILLTAAAAVGFAGGSVEVEPFVDNEGYTTIESADVELKWLLADGKAEFIIRAPTKGWIGIGFDPSNAMKDANFIIGYVKEGELFIEDHFGTGTFSHKSDTELGGTDNIENYSGREDDSGTEIMFTIPLNSGDSFDTTLKKGEEHTILIAYGPDQSDNFKTKHAKRISFSIKM